MQCFLFVLKVTYCVSGFDRGDFCFRQPPPHLLTLYLDTGFGMRPRAFPQELSIPLPLVNPGCRQMHSLEV